MSETILSLIQLAARARPDGPVLLAPGKEPATYSELLAQVENARDSFAALGLTGRSRVGIYAESGDTCFAMIVAAASWTIAAPLDTRATDDELKAALSDYKTNVVFVESSQMDRISPVVSQLGIDAIEIAPHARKAGLFETGSFRQAPAFTDLGEPGPDDPCLLLQTSGTTGMPKAILWNHRHPISGAERVNRLTKYSHLDVLLASTPLHHSGGLNGIVRVILVGGAMAQVSFDPNTYLETLKAVNPTTLSLTPALHQMLLERATAEDLRSSLTRLRYVRSGSAPLSDELKDRIREMFNVPVLNGYGSSETSTIAMTSLTDSPDREGSVGKVLHDGVEIRDDSGRPVKHGSEGEIWVSGPSVISGYEGDPPENATSFSHGWYRTGDRGIIDGDSFLYLTGRRSEVINRGGENISPEEVDLALETHPTVAAAAAFAVPDQSMGQEVWAVVEPIEGQKVLPSEIRAFASRVLSFAKVPKRVIVVDSIPRTVGGKVLRAKLTEQYRDGQ